MNRLIQTTLILSSLLCPAFLRAEDAPKLETDKDKVSYAIGMNMGRNLKNQGVEVIDAAFAAGARDAFAGNPSALSEEETRRVITAYQAELRTKQEAKRAEMEAERAKQAEKAKEAATKNREAGAAFLAANAKKSGVKTTASGLQYKILTEGKGEIPRENHEVHAFYRGTLIDGTEFDSSAKHGIDPSKFPVTGVIRGWTEALLMMPVGSKWQLYIPADLAYGDRPMGADIPAGSTLIFDIELVSTKGPEPIVSDIIKVPSAEEMKNGAKIETIKAEDVEKLKAQQKK